MAIRGGGHNCIICDEYAKMISGLRLLSWQLKSHGNSLNSHGKSWNCIIRFLWEPCILVE